VCAPLQGRRALQPTPPIKITHPAFGGFLLQGAISGFVSLSCFPFLVKRSLNRVVILHLEVIKMNNTVEKRYYTPQFSETASVSVRRFAWFLNKPMTVAIEKIIQLLPFILDASKVCETCKDSGKCSSCAFSAKKLSEEEQYKILAAL
jgi:hypothetical protein